MKDTKIPVNVHSREPLCHSANSSEAGALFRMAQPVGIQSLVSIKSTKTNALGLYISFRLVFLLWFSAKLINWAVNMIIMILKHLLCLIMYMLTRILLFHPR